MSRRHPFGWSLPPGVTDRMIDEAAGGYDEEPFPCPVCSSPDCQDPHEEETFGPMEHHLWSYRYLPGTHHVIIEHTDDGECIANIPVEEGDKPEGMLAEADAICAAHNATDPYCHLPLTGESARALLALITWAQATGYWPLTSLAHEFHRSYYDLLDNIRSQLYRISSEQPERERF